MFRTDKNSPIDFALLTSSTTATSRCSASTTSTTSSETGHGGSRSFVATLLGRSSCDCAHWQSTAGSQSARKKSQLVRTLYKTPLYETLTFKNNNLRFLPLFFLAFSLSIAVSKAFHTTALARGFRDASALIRRTMNSTMNSTTNSKAAVRAAAASSNTCLSNPRLDGFHMPAEWEAHERCGLAVHPVQS